MYRYSLAWLALSPLFASEAFAQRWGRKYGTTCEQFGFIHADKFNYNNGVWNPAVDGASCITVEREGTQFSSTWQWERGSDSLPVHAYPHVTFISRDLPLLLSDIRGLRVNGSWSMVPQDSSKSVEDIGLRANVALDLWADELASNTGNESDCSHEIMVWLGVWAQAQPYGRETITMEQGGVTYQVYEGTKEDGRRRTLSFLPQSENIERFDLDVGAFVQKLVDSNIISANLYLGQVQLGTEAFNSNENVTFTARDYSMNLTSANPRSTSSAPPSPRPPAGPTGVPPSIASGSGYFGWSWAMLLILWVIEMAI